jgi:hypothetical protein
MSGLSSNNWELLWASNENGETSEADLEKYLLATDQEDGVLSGTTGLLLEQR